MRELPSLYTKNNPVINWYLDQFERLIVKNAEDISEWARNWANQIDNYFNLKNKKETIETLNSTEELDQFTIEIQTRAAFPSKGNPGTSIEEKKAFLDNLWKVAYPKITENYYNALTELSSLCNDSLIEYTYCKTILESNYNDDYHHDNLFTENELDYYTKHPHYHPRLSEKDSRRKKAFNIRNSIRYIEDIKQKCDIWKNRITKTLIDEIFDLSSSHDVILNRLDTIIQKVNDQVEAVNELTEKVGTDVKYNTQLTEDATKLLHFGEKTNELNIELGKQSAKLGKLSFWISTVLGVLSVLLALFFGIRGSNIDCNCQSCNQQVQISSPTPHCPPHHIN